NTLLEFLVLQQEPKDAKEHSDQGAERVILRHLQRTGHIGCLRRAGVGSFRRFCVIVVIVIARGLSWQRSCGGWVSRLAALSCIQGSAVALFGAAALAREVVFMSFDALRVVGVADEEGERADILADVRGSAIGANAAVFQAVLQERSTMLAIRD